MEDYIESEDDGYGRDLYISPVFALFNAAYLHFRYAKCFGQYSPGDTHGKLMFNYPDISQAELWYNASDQAPCNCCRENPSTRSILDKNIRAGTE